MIRAIYKLNKNLDVNKTAEMIAIGQSTGIKLNNDTKHLENSQAKIVSIISDMEKHNVTIDFPTKNCNESLSEILTMVYGKISMAPGIHLLDIEFDTLTLKAFEPFQQELIDVSHTPLMAIFKPCVGLSITEHFDLFSQALLSGIDLIKDDEILFERDFNTHLKKIELCQNLLKDSPNKRYFPNFYGPVQDFEKRLDSLKSLNVSGILFSHLTFGLSAFEYLSSLCKDRNISIMTHPALAGSMISGAINSIDGALLLAKIPRFYGASYCLYPSPYGSVALDKELSLSINKNCKNLLGNLKPAASIPSAGINPAIIKQLINDFGRDIVINAGSAIFGHAKGVKEAVGEFREAISNAL